MTISIIKEEANAARRRTRKGVHIKQLNNNFIKVVSSNNYKVNLK